MSTIGYRSGVRAAVRAVARNATLYGVQRHDEDTLTRAVIQLASQYGRYGYRRITALLRDLGWNAGAVILSERRLHHCL